MPTDDGPGSSRRPPTIFDDLIAAARLTAGVPDDAPATVEAVTLRVGSRRVVARPGRTGWEYQVVAGRGRPPGPAPARVARDYQAILPIVRDLRARQRKEHPVTAVLQAPRLKTLALSWPDATLKTTPAWLQRAWRAADPNVDPTDAGLLIPLARLSDADLTQPLKAALDAWIVFEGHVLDLGDGPLTWNAFIVGDYGPADLARRMVAIRYAIRDRQPLSDDRVRHWIRKGRPRGA